MVHQVLSVQKIKNTFFEDRILINDVQDLSRPIGQERGIRAYSRLTALILSLFRSIVSLSYIQVGKDGPIYAVNSKSFEKFKQRTGYHEVSLAMQQSAREMVMQVSQTVRATIHPANPAPTPALPKQVIDEGAKSTEVTAPDVNLPTQQSAREMAVQASQTVSATIPPATPAPTPALSKQVIDEGTKSTEVTAPDTSTNPEKTSQQVIEMMALHLSREDYESHYEVGAYTGHFGQRDRGILRQVEAHFKKEGFEVTRRDTYDDVTIYIRFPKVIPADSGPLFAKCRMKYRELFMKFVREGGHHYSKKMPYEIALEYNYDDDAIYFKTELEKHRKYKVQVYKHPSHPHPVKKDVINGKYYMPGQIYLRISLK